MMEMKIKIDVPELLPQLKNLPPPSTKPRSISPCRMRARSTLTCRPATLPLLPHLCRRLPLLHPLLPLHLAPAPTPTPAAPPVTPMPTAAAPAPAVPVTAPTYTLDQIAKAGANLVDAGKMEQLLALLTKYGVQAVTQLTPDQYGAFATELRALGAQI